MLAWAEEYAKTKLRLGSGAKVVVLAGTPFGVSGTTNTLKIISL
jgi:pyruvate kinase